MSMCLCVIKFSYDTNCQTDDIIYAGFEHSEGRESGLEPTGVDPE